MHKFQPVTILHIIDSFNMGGLENGLLNIINNSDCSEFKHEICCIKHSGEAARRLCKKIKIYELNKIEGNDWKIYLKLIQIIKKSNPDIIHTRNWGAVDGIVAAKLACVKAIIHSEHGWNADDPTGTNKKRLLIRKFSSLFVDRYVAVSNDIGNWLELSCRIRSEKISTIINGVDVNKFHPHGDVKKIRYDLSGSASEIVIGTAGRLDPIKNFDVLIKAFSMLELEYNNKNVRMIIAGDGREKENLEETAKKYSVLDRINFLGERHDIQNIYKMMDVFVLPSRNEGISNTILEAMATGLPVIATHVGGNPELVTHNSTGLLIKPNSIDSILDALKYYIDNPDIMKLHGNNARKRVLSSFSLQKMLYEYNRIYRKYGNN